MYFKFDVGGSLAPPQFLMLRDGRSLVLWMMGDTVYYQYLDSKGEPQGRVRSGKGALSDCVPVEQGVTNGTDATHFSPDAYCTRGQIVTFLYRAMG